MPRLLIADQDTRVQPDREFSSINIHGMIIPNPTTKSLRKWLGQAWDTNANSN
jgi:hypothetical protein